MTDAQIEAVAKAIAERMTERCDEATDRLLALFPPAQPLSQDNRSVRTVGTVDELEALPDDSVIRDDAGWVYDKQVPEGWVCAGASERNEYDIKLPATVLTPTTTRDVGAEVTVSREAKMDEWLAYLKENGRDHEDHWEAGWQGALRAASAKGEGK